MRGEIVSPMGTLYQNMSQRKKWGTNLMIGNAPFFGMWWSSRDFGISFGIKMKGSPRSVHLTIVFRDDALNCHITDTAKNPKKVWEANMSVVEFFPIYQEFQATCMRRYYWHQKYYQLDDGIVETMRVLENSKGTEEYVVAPLLEAYLNEDIFVKKRIRKGFHEGQRFGFIFEGDDPFFVIPFSKKNMFVTNSDLRKTPFWRIPTVQGFPRYFDYLEEEGLLEQAILFEPDRKIQVEAALMSILAKAESNED